VSRVIAYVDGFNLYYGLKTKHGRRYLWLDLQLLAGSLLLPDQNLTSVKYFTARVRNDPQGEQRQSDYIDALSIQCPLLTVIDGRFQEKDHSCHSCGSTWKGYEEKETDVSIAVALVEDAVLDSYDVALLISADSDLCPSVRSVKRLRPSKRIIAAFPPRRRSGGLAATVHANFTIGDAKIRQAQLPPTIVSPGGIVLSKPTHWT
jgi:uncharacterized LabA/DUF88 family protein